MLNTEREAKRLIDGEWSSWSARGRMHKAYRNMNLTPEEEVPRHRRCRKGRKRHVHKWGPWRLLRGEERRRWTRGPSGYWRSRSKYTTYLHERACKKCGLKERGYASAPGGAVDGSGRWWLG